MLPTRLNVGCGRDVLDGWVNLDMTWHDGMVKNRDLKIALGPDHWSGPLDHFTEIRMSHVVEHIPGVLNAMEDLWRSARDGCKLTVRCPHGSSDDASGDPTHVRPMWESSFIYWGQGAYFKADYGYRGDWALDKVTLITEGLDLTDPNHAYQMTRRARNYVTEMVAELHAVKPARPPVRESQDAVSVVLV